MAGSEKIALEGVDFDWRVIVDLWLIRDGHGKITAYRNRVKRGEYQVLGVFADGKRIGSLLWSIENNEAGRALVVNALSARSATGRDLTADVFRKMAILAKAGGCVSMRAWTKRRGLVRLMERAGAKTSFAMELNLVNV